MKTCLACGMPLIEKDDFSQGDEKADFCKFCTNQDGSVKSCKEIFEGGVSYFLSNVTKERSLAEKIVRKNMSQLPYWKDKECELLKGEMVSDEEFGEVVKKL